MRESWGVRRLFVVLVLGASGCLAEYVLPGGSRGDTASTGDTQASGDVPTGSGTVDDTGKGGTQGDSEGGCDSECDECTAGTSRCGEQCFDLQTDEQHCGSCEEVCKADEMCIVGECRDVLVLECDACPCADQCPGDGDGLIEATGGGDGGGETDDSGGKAPQQGLCCELAAAMQVICVIADVGETLECP